MSITYQGDYGDSFGFSDPTNPQLPGGPNGHSQSTPPPAPDSSHKKKDKAGKKDNPHDSSHKADGHYDKSSREMDPMDFALIGLGFLAVYFLATKL